MKEYHKINTIYKRTEKGELIIGEYSLPVLEYLKNNQWYFTEKVDGTNIRIYWNADTGVRIGGRTDNAQIPVFLIDKLNEILPASKFTDNIEKTNELTLYGEGYGAKIQKGGKYIPDGCNFVLFDVLVDNWWLSREDVEDVARRLGIAIVPVIGRGTLKEAAELTHNGFDSAWGDFTAEGIVLKPSVELFDRNNQRVITKIKHKDFKKCAKR